MNKTMRLRVAAEYLGRLASYASRKRAILDVRRKWGVSRRSIDRYVAELRSVTV